MAKTLGEIAQFVEGEVVGNKNILITGLKGIKEAEDGDLTFIDNSKYKLLVEKTKAAAIITPKDMVLPGRSVIRIKNPSLAFAKTAALFAKKPAPQLKGIHPSAVIDPSARLGKDVAVGPFTVIERDVTVGDRTVIQSGCFIGAQTEIGSDCQLSPRVTVMPQNTLGNRIIIHSGTVIGSDGFGYVFDKGAHQKIAQLGNVVIGDDVEIGANVTIDRARFDKTVIGRGTKIDNLVHIAHNVTIGENCIIVAQVGISGSTTVGKNAVLAGQAGVSGHLTIGDGAVVASQAGVTKSVPAGAKVSGYPARDHTQAKRVNAAVQRLPYYVKIIRDLQAKIQGPAKKRKGKK